MTTNTNLAAFALTARTLLSNPSQFLPHLTIPTFTHLPPNLSQHLTYTSSSSPPTQPTIRAIVLDKDDTLSPPKTTSISPPIYQRLESLRSEFPNPNSILIVSNRAGSHAAYEGEVKELESQLGELRIPVFQLPKGSTKKPFCGDEVVRWFRERGVIKAAAEIAVVGDRLGTDGMMAGRMGSWSVWVRDGVGRETAGGKRNGLERMEAWVERLLRVRCGLRPSGPRGWNGLDD